MKFLSLIEKWDTEAEGTDRLLFQQAVSKCHDHLLHSETKNSTRKPLRLNGLVNPLRPQNPIPWLWKWLRQSISETPNI